MSEFPTREDLLSRAWSLYQESKTPDPNRRGIIPSPVDMLREAEFLVAFASALPTEPTDITDQFMNMEDDRP